VEASRAETVLQGHWTPQSARELIEEDLLGGDEEA
jgi:hypothetical protein